MAKSSGKRGSADAAKKRSIARRFNDVLTRNAPRSKALDKRTARRLDRYRVELKKGTKAGSKALSPLDVAMRVNELLKHGDRIRDIRKLAKPRSIDYDDERMVSLIREMHPVYRFRPEAYRFAGVTNETLVAAGVLDRMPKKRGPRPKKKAKAPSRSPRAKAAKKSRR